MEDTEMWPKFPEPVQPVFANAWQTVAFLHSVWNLYLDLFRKPENIDVLNKTTPAAFKIIERCLRTDMAMAFGRLLDPAEQGGNKNLSLQHLVQVLRTHVDGAALSTVEKQLTEIKIQCEPILKSRMKVYGHTDRKTALQYHENPLPHIKRSTIEKSLEMIRDFMNGIQGHFQGGVTVFDNPALFGTGADLVELLRRHVQNVEQERKRMLSEFGR
jgi:hypothetical protein